jgi:glutaredoxin-like protein NrdH
MNEQQLITVYTSGPQCVDCNTVKRWLGEHGYTYTERNIRTEPEALDQLRQLGYSSVPITVVGNAVIDGLDIPALQAALSS